MSRKKSTLVLGYTRAGHAVILPTHATPDMSQHVTWTPGDHLDASRILMEHGEREEEPVGSWCASWARAHRAIGKSRRSRQKPCKSPVRGAAEAAILIGRPKR